MQKGNSHTEVIIMPEIKFYHRQPVPMEMHKVKIVQKLNLLPARERLQRMPGRWL